MVSNKKQKEINSRTIKCECCKKEIIPMANQKLCSSCSRYHDTLRVQRNSLRTQLNKLKEIIQSNGLNLNGNL